MSLTIEVRFDASGIKFLRSFFEYNDNDVVAEVSFSFNLLRVIGRVRQQSGHVEHNLEAVILVIYGVLAGGIS